MWVLLEINTLSFCSVMKMNQKENSQESMESLMKYFIIQSIASSILLISMVYMKYNTNVMGVVVVAGPASVMIKAGAAPFHQWFVNISKKLKWSLNSLLFTWQKLAPIYLIVYQYKVILIVFIVMSSMIGSVSMVNKKDLKEIMALSSVFNLSWMILAVIVSTKMLIMFSSLYWMTLLFALIYFYKVKGSTLSKLKTSSNKWVFLFMMVNLAGLPPLMGFTAKWMTMLSTLKMNVSFVVTFLLVISTINLYIYFRIASPISIPQSKGMQKSVSWENSLITSTFIMMNTIVLLSVFM
uniref:NADH-ubiquinone oxidoreductase chain 2 n=1 Tax=Oribatula sp. XFX TaxID=2652662 RepID=A0A5J6VDB0_9ACAR|nr:NADH dehydrogenase subunit 2 [Oribatula sp. XFX]